MVTLDPPAVGESDEPDDGYTLTPDLVADVNAHAFDQVLARWPDATRIGVGHSAGALLTVVQQARHRTYDALGLFGFGRGGHERFALTQSRSASRRAGSSSSPASASATRCRVVPRRRRRSCSVGWTCRRRRWPRSAR